MIQTLKNALQQPEALEALYRKQPDQFRQAFAEVYAENPNNSLLSYWHHRLQYGQKSGLTISNGLWILLVGIAVAGLLAKLPAWINVDYNQFMPRNIGFILFPGLIAWFVHQNKHNWTIPACITAGLVLYINLLPGNLQQDSFSLICMHLPILLWAIVGHAYTGGRWQNVDKRTEFLRYNGDLAIMSVLVGLCGIALVGMTFGLFELIGISLEKLFQDYLAMWALPAVPLVASYLVQTQPQLVNRVSPVLARVFTPLVLITLLIYLVAVIFTGRNPFIDRDLLLLFNVMLLAVVALIFFSISGRSESGLGKRDSLILLLLALSAILVNGVALTAIIYRISTWGITPNRLTVLGSNLLILGHLLVVANGLFRISVAKSDENGLNKRLVSYLPYYALYALLVMLAYPLIFDIN
jgi:hypothetical protein